MLSVIERDTPQRAPEQVFYAPVRQEVLTAAEYLERVKTDRANILSVSFIPPALGDGSFGKFVVTYRYLHLRAVHG